MSFVGGASISVGYFYAGFKMFSKNDLLGGRRIALLTSIILFVIGTWRYMKSGKFMPAGISKSF